MVASASAPWAQMVHGHDSGIHAGDQGVGRKHVADAEGDVRQDGATLTARLDLEQCHMTRTYRRDGQHREAREDGPPRPRPHRDAHKGCPDKNDRHDGCLLYTHLTLPTNREV